MGTPTSEGEPPEDQRLSFLLDTDTCSAYIKGVPRAFNRFVQYGGRLHIATATLAELATWALRAHAPPSRLPKIQDLLTLVRILDVTTDAAWKFGQIQAALFDGGRPAPNMDLLNAATALIQNFTLVTHNVQDYANIPGLTIDDWLVP